MADFQANIGEFEARNVAVYAFSVDSKEDAQESIDTLGLTFPVGYGIDHLEFATKTGAYYEVRRSIIHATGFILKSDGSVLNAVYANSPIGRYDTQGVLGVIDFYIRKAQGG